jgi:hypothetical protein
MKTERKVIERIKVRFTGRYRGEVSHAWATIVEYTKTPTKEGEKGTTWRMAEMSYRVYRKAERACTYPNGDSAVTTCIDSDGTVYEQFRRYTEGMGAPGQLLGPYYTVLH